MRAIPWPEAETGADALCIFSTWQPCRVGKGAGTTFNANEQLSCAVPTIRIEDETHDRWWARRTRGPPSLTCYASAFAHPTTRSPLSQGRMETATMEINSALLPHRSACH